MNQQQNLYSNQEETASAPSTHLDETSLTNRIAASDVSQPSEQPLGSTREAPAVLSDTLYTGPAPSPNLRAEFFSRMHSSHLTDPSSLPKASSLFSDNHQQQQDVDHAGESMEGAFDGEPPVPSSSQNPDEPVPEGSQASDVPPKKKRGRKPLPDAAQRRKAQNRTAQKSFRARKLQKEKELHLKAARFDELRAFAINQITGLVQDNNALRKATGQEEMDADDLLNHPSLSIDFALTPIDEECQQAPTPSTSQTPSELVDGTEDTSLASPTNDSFASQGSSSHKPPFRHAQSWPNTFEQSHQSNGGPPSPNRSAHARSAPVEWPHLVDTHSLTESGGSNYRPTHLEHASQGWPPPGLPDPFLPMLAGTPQPLFQMSNGATANPFESMFGESAPGGSSQPDAIVPDAPAENSTASHQTPNRPD